MATEYGDILYGRQVAKLEECCFYYDSMIWDKFGNEMKCGVAFCSAPEHMSCIGAEHPPMPWKEVGYVKRVRVFFDNKE